MKLAYVDLCGFRGYRNPLRIDFADGFTIIDGSNGSGKSTIFDAVEFALTGTITKYGDATADNETVIDYLWWRGEGPVPASRYVEVGFRDDAARELVVRRTHLAEVTPHGLSAVLEALYDIKLAPGSPLPQLCAASIIRDELISALSLDLKETERYSRVREAIGATDADTWIERGSRLLNLAKKRAQALRTEVDAAARDVAAVARRIDDIRATVVEEQAIAGAVARLQLFAGSTAAPDQLFEPARAAIGERSRKLEQLAKLEVLWGEAEAAQGRLQKLEEAVVLAETAKERADASYATLTATGDAKSRSDAMAQEARAFSALVELGQRLGLRDGHCPLCASELTASEFAKGLALAESYAKRLDSEAVEDARREAATKAAVAAAEATRRELEQSKQSFQASQRVVKEFGERLQSAGLPQRVGIAELHEHQRSLRAEVDAARADLRVVETLKLNSMLERVVHEEKGVKGAYERAEGRLGLARRVENRAQELYDTARRAAFETVNQRFERVLPLMAELYQRLRPHPVWVDIEYRIRGDVRRFLKLEVGDQLNPQFIFSSGQRRATGLAFLLAVNLSLAWSRWRTILLDDPVQHIDDFRSVHLAEVLAQLSGSGKQIICAVEDAALADLLCRRLPIGGAGKGKRLTLGSDAGGALAKLREQELAPLTVRALVTEPEPQRLAG